MNNNDIFTGGWLWLEEGLALVPLWWSQEVERRTDQKSRVALADSGEFDQIVEKVDIGVDAASESCSSSSRRRRRR